ncbi:MAG: hypothetical protein AAGF11_21025 [Myxococcota bacterium]
MGHDFTIDGETYALLRNNTAPSGLECVPGVEVVALVQEWAATRRFGALSWLGDGLGLTVWSPADVHALLRTIEDQLLALRPTLALYRKPRPVLDTGFPCDVVDLCDLAEGPPDLPTEEADHWIEIHLVDEAEQPITNERYRIELPDGKTQEGHTDGHGIVRIDPIFKAGNCRISLPDLADELIEDAAEAA